MQNKSYDKYIELIKSAELPAYERTSKRFIATIGSVGGASWFAQNPSFTLLASLTAIVGGVVLYVTLVTGGKIDSISAGNQTHAFVQNQTVQKAETPATVEVSSPITHVDRTAVLSTDSRNSALTPAPLAGASNEANSAGEEETNMSNILKVNDHDEAPHDQVPEVAQELSPIHSSSVRLDAERLMRSQAAYRTNLASILDPSSFRTHYWMLQLSGSSLPLGAGNAMNMRATALVQIGKNVVLGVGVGARTVSIRKNVFLGFKDTVFEVGEDVMTSKIGRYRKDERSTTYAEAGVAIEHRLIEIFGSDRISASIGCFAGLEGLRPILEPSTTLDLMLTDRLYFYGGASLRSYVLGTESAALRPLVGFRIGM